MTLAVLDTNVLVSAVLSPVGNEAAVVHLFRRQLISVAVSAAILDEYQLVLKRDKFHLDPEYLDDFLLPFRRFAMLFNPVVQVAVSPDRFDNRFLECAEAAKADFLITGNLRHFPESYAETRIVNARVFLDMSRRPE